MLPARSTCSVPCNRCPHHPVGLRYSIAVRHTPEQYLQPAYLCFIEAARLFFPRFSQLAISAASSSLNRSWHCTGGSFTLLLRPSLRAAGAAAGAACAAGGWLVPQPCSAGRLEQLSKPDKVSEMKPFCCNRKLRTSPNATCLTAMESWRRECISSCNCCRGPSRPCSCQGAGCQ